MTCKVVYSEQMIAHNIHVHTNYELLYVVEGEVTMLIGQREFHLGSGSMIFLNQFEEHATQLSGDVYRRFYLLIPPASLQDYSENSVLLSVFRLHGAHFPYVLSTGGAKPAFDTYFSMLLEAAQSKSPYAEQRVQALLTLILTHAYDLRPDMFAPVHTSMLISIRSILDELDRRFAQEISLSELAERYHVSTSCLTRHFREYVGMSPMQYITQSRLTLAKHLLMNTEQPVSQVASACGFKDASNFIRRFKVQFGCSPLQFRHSNQPDAQIHIGTGGATEEREDGEA